jgi:hypothetical protein
MSRQVDNARLGACVNVLKKVRTNGSWKLCPVVRESNGRLRDRVRVNGRTEVHSEGVYYLEWREAGRRLREAVPNHAEVLERARLKSLELEARRAGAALDTLRDSEPPRSSIPANRMENGTVVIAALPPSTNAERLLLNGIDAYIRERVDAAVRARLAAMGLSTGEARTVTPEPKLLAASVNQENPSQNRSESIPGPAQSDGPATSTENEVTVAEAIEMYLKDVEPPQREFKTYEEYRNVLYRFRDTCKKECVKDVNRNDCLEFMRHLYSIGNEARTVYNRIGIVQQWLKLNGITGLLHGRDKPSFVTNMREMYQPEDLEALFRACDPEERIRYVFFLLSGERDKEVRYTSWSDIDFNRKCVRVTAKKQLGFKPKEVSRRPPQMRSP